MTLQKHWPILLMDQTVSKIVGTKPTLIARRATNFRDKLVHSEFKSQTNMPRQMRLRPVWGKALTCSEAMCNAAELEPALKGYGAKIRAPHALVMTLLFKSGSLKDKLKAIFQATFTHSRNLAYFVFTYKSILTAQEKLHGSKWQFHSFLAACVGGWVVFGENNTINSQINMYLLSRVLFGMSRLAVEKGFIPEPKCDVFPFFSALVWGLVLWMFEYHRHTLQPSLQSSMTYLYDDSNIWHDISDFLIYNKPKQEK
ncbi:peroxisomal membrane protein 4-like [Mantella aurantiaca]